MTNAQSTFRLLCRGVRRRGFTLIEVMLATVILGLGVLGLAALFAGAAGQQRLANEINLSVGMARNAEALLTRNLGRLAGDGLIRIVERGEDGHWFPAPASRLDWSLTLDPDERGLLFFLVDATGQTVYQVQRDPNEPPDGQFMGEGDSMSSSVIQSSLRPLPDARVNPRNLRVTVTIGQFDGQNVTIFDPIEFSDPGLDDEIIFSSPPLAGVLLFSDTNQPPPGFDPASDFNQARTEAAANPDFNRFAWVRAADPPQGRFDTAEVHFFLDDLEQNQWIESVVIEPYQWRNTRIVSLNDRFIFDRDDRYPGGRRPVMGYTALLRTVDGGAASQLTIFTYSLSPVAIPRSNNENRPFIPPETEQDLRQNRGLLRRFNGVDLGWDTDLEQYYIEVADTASPTRRHVTQQGQILMMIQSDGLDLGGAAGGLDDSTPGSDVPVRVIAQRRVDGKLRGYLDGSPRVQGRSPLRQRTTGATVSIDVWAFNATAISHTSDGTEWRIRPVEARQFQLVFDN